MTDYPNFRCIGCCFIDVTPEGQDYCIPFNVLTGNFVRHDRMVNDMFTSEYLDHQRIVVAAKTIINGNIYPGTRFGDGEHYER
jgi:hypothetical protein